MTIFRIQKDKNNPYVMINRSMVQDAALSARAKGILTYLLSNNDNWQIHEIEILRHFTDGRHSIRAGIKELINAGYIHRERVRDADTGQLREMAYSVYEYPINSIPITKDRFTNVGESHTTNNKITKRGTKKRADAWDDANLQPCPGERNRYDTDRNRRQEIDNV